MEQQITKSKYDVRYLLAEENYDLIEQRFSYPENLVPLLPSVGDFYEHSKVAYKIRAINHSIWKNNDGSHTHSVIVNAKVETQ
jgi:hypothetical protein